MFWFNKVNSIQAVEHFFYKGSQGLCSRHFYPVGYLGFEVGAVGRASSFIYCVPVGFEGCLLDYILLGCYLL